MSCVMRPVTAVEVAANAATRWREQYRDWRPSDTFADGTTLESHNEALNSGRHTPEHIAKVLNPGWAYPQCTCCGKRFHSVVRMRENWGDAEFDFCKPCIERALLMFSGIDGGEVSE